MIYDKSFCGGIGLENLQSKNSDSKTVGEVC